MKMFHNIIKNFVVIISAVLVILAIVSWMEIYIKNTSKNPEYGKYNTICFLMENLDKND